MLTDISSEGFFLQVSLLVDGDDGSETGLLMMVSAAECIDSTLGLGEFSVYL